MGKKTHYHLHKSCDTSQARVLCLSVYCLKSVKIPLPILQLSVKKLDFFFFVLFSLKTPEEKHGNFVKIPDFLSFFFGLTEPGLNISLCL